MIIAEAKETDLLGSMISPKAQMQVQNMDFSQYFAVAVFQGVKPTSGYDIEIKKVTQIGSAVIVYAHFVIPEPMDTTQQIETSPYQLLKVSKGDLHGQVEFTLRADGTAVVSPP